MQVFDRVSKPVTLMIFLCLSFVNYYEFENFDSTNPYNLFFFCRAMRMGMEMTFH